MFDTRGPVEVERAGRGRDEDSQETLDQVKGRWRRELGGALVTVVKRKTKFTGSFSFIILRKRANLLLPFRLCTAKQSRISTTTVDLFPSRLEEEVLVT